MPAAMHTRPRQGQTLAFQEQHLKTKRLEQGVTLMLTETLQRNRGQVSYKH